MHTPRANIPGRPTPLPLVLALTWLSSLSTVAFMLGIFFVAQRQYGFSRTDNLLLGLVLGATYVPGAMLIGPALRRLAERVPWISTRAVLAVIMVLLAAAAAAPWFFKGHVLAVWLAAPAFNAMNGALWPIVESYLSGARRADALRKATGWFNIVWSSAGVAAGFVIAPILEWSPLAVPAFAALVQVLSCFLLFPLTPEPPRHLTDAHPHPPVYERLLAACRWLLPTSYVLSYCLAPMLPDLVKTLDVPSAWQAPLAWTWQASRFAVFALFFAWGGWHGRWGAIRAAAAIILAGFALSVLASSPAILALGLILFGAGMGAVYSAAIYYAMEVGAAEVEAGGVHESLIGVGYTLGPLGGLAAGAVSTSVGVSPAQATAALLLIVVAAGLAGAWAWSGKVTQSNR
ncbi:MAG: MFS transporter [Phycisphaerales bacterium]